MHPIGDLLIAPEQELSTLLSSPRVSPGTIVRLDRLDPRSVSDASSGSGMIGLSRELFLDPAGVGGGRQGHTAEESGLASLAARRVTSLHVVRSEDAGAVERIIELERLFRARFRAISDVDRIRNVPWHQVLVFLRPVRRGELQILEEFIQSLESLEADRVGPICRSFVVDSRLRSTADHVLLEAASIWPELVAGVIHLIRGAEVETHRNPVRLVAWRHLEVGPSIPDAEFQSMFRTRFLVEEESRELTEKELEGLPTIQSRWVTNPDVVDRSIRELDVGGDGGRRLEFRPRGWVARARERQVASRLPDAEAAKRRRTQAGKSWRHQSRERLSGLDVALNDWEESAWSLASATPGGLAYLADVETGRGEVLQKVNDQRTAWSGLWKEIERQDRQRLELLAGAEVLDELHQHFVSWAGRLVMGVIGGLIMIYLAFVVIAPLFPGGIPWWVWASGAAGVAGALSAGFVSQQAESPVGVDLAARLEERVAALAAEDVTRQALSIMKKGQDVGDEQSAMFSRQSVRGLAGRAQRSLRSGLNPMESLATKVNPSAGVPSARLVVPQEAQKSAFERASVIATHGTEDPNLRRSLLEEGMRKHIEDVRRILDAGWRDLFLQLDRERRGRLPGSDLRLGWKSVVAECAREMRSLVIRDIAESGGRREFGVVRTGTLETIEQLMGLRTQDDPHARCCLSCRVSVDDVGRWMADGSHVQGPMFRTLEPPGAVGDVLRRIRERHNLGVLNEPSTGPVGFIFEEVPLRSDAYGEVVGEEGS